MHSLIELLTTYGPVLSALGAVVAFFWTVIQFLSVRAREARNREFETYHKLIKELVEPSTPDGHLYMDRQCAVMFELRFFPRYYPVIKRTLGGLKSTWDLGPKHERLIEEIEITLKYLKEHNSRWQRVYHSVFKVNY